MAKKELQYKGDGYKKKGGLTVFARAADGVDVDVARVDVEIQPVENVGLDQTEDGLAEKGVEAVALVLV